MLLQQLLVDAIDLLDPDYVRVPANRRIRLAPVAYQPLPNVEQYKAALTLLSGPMDATRFGAGFGSKADTTEVEGEHFQALQNLLHPERVVEAANQVRRAAAVSKGSGNGSMSTSPVSTADEEAAGAGGAAAAQPILPPFQLPSVGATGVQLLQALSGQQRPQPQPQLPQEGSALSSQDFGGTAVTADPVRSRTPSSSNSSGSNGR